MNKFDLSKNINNVAKGLCRTISVDRKLDLREGDLYNNQGKVESWQDDNAKMGFRPEIEDELIYSFIVENVPCFKVNYEDEELCEFLDCIGCEDESECLVHPDIKFVITRVSTDEDFKEMGYYEILLEEIKED